MRRLLGALLVAGSLIGSVSVASASGSWSGFWTFDATPPPGEFVWTWVWTVGSPTNLTASASAALFSSTANWGTDEPDFYGITINDFGSLRPEGVKLSGLLSTEFEIRDEGYGGLSLRYIGSALLNPGENLGTMTLFDPAASPFDVPPVTLDYTATFQTTSGFLQDSGTISSAVPEPSTWAMMLLGFVGLGFVGYCRTRALKSVAVTRLDSIPRR
jgi:PEP-CTERM motif